MALQSYFLCLNFMSPNKSLVYRSFLFFALVLGTEALAQKQTRPFAAVDAGNMVMAESEDLRFVLFQRADVEDRVRRGVVCAVESNFIVTHVAHENSTNNWKNVASVLASLKRLDRNKALPQIKVVQKNAILQSSLGTSGSGFVPEFLERELKAGDIVVITRIYD